MLLAADTPERRARALERDPVRFPRRYTSRPDVEVAAVLAAMCAYGRVDLYGPVLEGLLTHADRRGGPAALAMTFSTDDARALGGVRYRWNPPEDFHALLRLLGGVLRDHGSVGALFAAGPLVERLSDAIVALRARPEAAAANLRAWLPSPRDGSACKRWLMLLRWMVRHDDVDLGVWTHLSPRDLILPLDTHTGRISRFLGLSNRATADWRMAEEVTRGLARLEPDDPVRFDFALAHLGISGGCKGYRHATICAACPVTSVCRAPAEPRADR